MPTFGLTGNFGMGKSTVLRMFSRFGAFTYDIDEFVHTILEKPSIIQRIVAVLGSNILIQIPKKRSINKKRMAEIIFKDRSKRKAIEEIIHPEVLQVIEDTESEIARTTPGAVIIFEVPLLFEARYENFFDKTIVVYCRRDIALNRLMKKGFTRDEALTRIRAQMPITAKIKRADVTVNNNGDLKTTESRVRTVFNRLTGN